MKFTHQASKLVTLYFLQEEIVLSDLEHLLKKRHLFTSGENTQRIREFVRKDTPLLYRDLDVRSRVHNTKTRYT